MISTPNAAFRSLSLFGASLLFAGLAGLSACDTTPSSSDTLPPSPFISATAGSTFEYQIAHTDSAGKTLSAPTSSHDSVVSTGMTFDGHSNVASLYTVTGAQAEMLRYAFTSDGDLEYYMGDQFKKPWVTMPFSSSGTKDFEYRNDTANSPGFESNYKESVSLTKGTPTTMTVDGKSYDADVVLAAFLYVYTTGVAGQTPSVTTVRKSEAFYWIRQLGIIGRHDFGFPTERSSKVLKSFKLK